MQVDSELTENKSLTDFKGEQNIIELIHGSYHNAICWCISNFYIKKPMQKLFRNNYNNICAWIPWTAKGLMKKLPLTSIGLGFYIVFNSQHMYYPGITGNRKLPS